MNDLKLKLYQFLEKNNPSLNFNELEIKINIFFRDINKFNITDEKYIFQKIDNLFFILPETKEIKIQNLSNYNKILEISKLSKKNIHFNDFFMMLYLYSNSYLSAYSFNKWILFSLSQVINHFNYLLSKEPNIEWLSLGYHPIGIGHYYSLRMNINNGKLFIQRDGGSNDKEKEENWNQYKNQDLLSVDYIDFSILIYLLSSKIYDSN
jgi:hypothetical protein